MTLNPQQSWDSDATTPALVWADETSWVQKARCGGVLCNHCMWEAKGRKIIRATLGYMGQGIKKNMPLSQRKNKDWGVLSIVNERLWF